MEVIVLIALSLAFIATWAVVVARSGSRWRDGLPPGPPTLPILGNLLQLRRNPHRSLAKLANTYGPLMSLKLGTRTAVVVSSPEMVTEVMQRNGLASSNRFRTAAMAVHGHDEVSMGTLPATSDGWKKLRRIGKERLFSNQALEQSQSLRRERLTKLADHVSSCCGGGRAMNVGEATFVTMFNVMVATFFSDVDFAGSFSGSAATKEFQAHVNGFINNIGIPNISDFIPILAPLDPQGIRRKVGFHYGSMLAIVRSIIEQRLKQRRAASSTPYQKKNDFLETLLDLMEGNECELSINEIEHFCLDLLFGGSDTSAASTEWTMVELLLHPEVLAKVKAEMKSVVGEKRIIEESDISRLPYLQATIKESFRLHPIGPLLSPREAADEMLVKGYKIPKDAQIIVNFWAITRDPSVWKDPERFDPERFLGKNIDFQGQNPELIPFGSGRRICPGMPLASRMVHCMVATLCHNFDWELERGKESKQLQREDVFGTVLHKKNPLWAIPIKV